MNVSVAGSGSVYMDRAVDTVEISQTSASFLRRLRKTAFCLRATGFGPDGETWSSVMRLSAREVKQLQTERLRLAALTRLCQVLVFSHFTE